MRVGSRSKAGWIRRRIAYLGGQSCRPRGLACDDRHGRSVIRCTTDRTCPAMTMDVDRNVPSRGIHRRDHGMLDYRTHYAVMVTEDRIRDLRREASLRRRLEGAPRPTPRRAGRRRWNVADLVDLILPKRGSKTRTRLPAVRHRDEPSAGGTTHGDGRRRSPDPGTQHRAVHRAVDRRVGRPGQGQRPGAPRRDPRVVEGGARLQPRECEPRGVDGEAWLDRRR